MGKQVRSRSSHAPPGVLALVVVCLVGLFASSNAYGATIDLSTLLSNASFEGGNQSAFGCPVGWTCALGGGANPGSTFTSYAPTAAQFTAGSDGLGSGIVPSGSSVGSSPVPVEGSGSTMQSGSLGTYVTGNTYILDLFVGTPKTIPFCQDSAGNVAPGCSANVTPNGQYPGAITAYFLSAGGVAEQIGLSAPGVGQWQGTLLSYTATLSDNGKAIGFEIADAGGGNNEIVNYDIVATAPEPTSLILLGSGLLFIGAAKFRKRRAR